MFGIAVTIRSSQGGVCSCDGGGLGGLGGKVTDIWISDLFTNPLFSFFILISFFLNSSMSRRNSFRYRSKFSDRGVMVFLIHFFGKCFGKQPFGIPVSRVQLQGSDTVSHRLVIIAA